MIDPRERLSPIAVCDITVKVRGFSSLGKAFFNTATLEDGTSSGG